eukprot:3461723-Rhodomonas_salina.1
MELNSNIRGTSESLRAQRTSKAFRSKKCGGNSCRWAPGSPLLKQHQAQSPRPTHWCMQTQFEYREIP